MASHHLVEFALEPLQNALLQARYVGLGNSEEIRDVLLRHLLSRAKSEAEFHDGAFSFAQLVERVVQQLAIDFVFEIPIDGIRICAEHIRQQQLVPVPVDVERLVQRDLGAQFVVPAKVHQDFILDTPRGVRRQLDFLGRIERVHRFDEPDGPDGHEILDVDASVLELAGDVHDEPQVALNEHGSHGRIARGQALKQILLFLLGQRRRQRLASADVIDLIRLTQEANSQADVEKAKPKEREAALGFEGLEHLHRHPLHS